MQICHIWDFMGLANEPNWSDWMSSALFQPFSNPFHKNYGPEVYLAYFITFGPTWASLCHFWSPGANFWQFLPGKKAQHCLAWCPLLCSNLVAPLPTQKRPSGLNFVAKKQFSAYLGHFLAPLGLWEGPNMRNALCSSLISVSVLSGTTKNIDDSNGARIPSL